MMRNETNSAQRQQGMVGASAINGPSTEQLKQYARAEALRLAAAAGDPTDLTIERARAYAKFLANG